MFDWHKKEKPIQGLMGAGGGATGYLVRGGPAAFEATGGSKFTSGLLTYHLFTNTGPNPFTVVGSSDVTVFMVAGGGGGNDGGGGAGGIREVSSFSVSDGEYVAQVGGGGAGSPGPRSSSTAWPTVYNGGHTEFYLSGISYPNPNYLRATGGGVGGRWGGSGFAGGSGGGAGNRTNSPGGAGNTPPEPGQYGNNGGASDGQPEENIGGGGGGAGGAGVPGGASQFTPVRGNGGSGQPFPTYAAPIIAPYIPAANRSAFTNAVGPTGLYAGGGGGGGRLPGDSTGTIGGPGGGGPGGPGGSSGTSGDPAVFGTGGGGGGGGYYAPGSSYGPGGSGAQGIIIITYPTPT